MLSTREEKGYEAHKLRPPQQELVARLEQLESEGHTGAIAALVQMRKRALSGLDILDKRKSENPILSEKEIEVEKQLKAFVAGRIK